MVKAKDHDLPTEMEPTEGEASRLTAAAQSWAAPEALG